MGKKKTTVDNNDLIFEKEASVVSVIGCDFCFGNDDDDDDDDDDVE